MLGGTMAVTLLQGSRSSWTPALIFGPGVTGWWHEPVPGQIFQDAAGTTPATVAGDVIGLTKDRSSNGFDFTQANAAMKPTLQFNGAIPLYRGDGTDDQLAHSAGTAKTVFSLFVGVRGITASSTDRQLVGQYTTGGNQRCWRLQKRTAAKFLYFAQSPDGIAVVTTANSSAVDNAVVAVIAGGAQTKFYVNETLVGTISGSIFAGNTITQFMGTGGAGSFGGDVTTMFLVDYEVGDGQRLSAQRYVNALTGAY